MSFPTETVSLPGSGLVFINSYSATVTDAYRTAIITAENTLQADFTNATTVTVSFGYSSLGRRFAAENTYDTVDTTYSAFTAALRAHATTADDMLAVGGLPASDPSNGAGFAIPTAEAVLLGLATPSGAVEDTVTLNSNLNFTFGQDAVGAIEHELTEGIFGRTGSLGFSGAQWNPLDLFRFTAAGQRDFTGGSDGVPTFFGLDGAHVSSLAFHNAISAGGVSDGQDLGDWDNTDGDAFGPITIGGPSQMSAIDLQVLDILGWTPSSASGGAPPAGVVLTGGPGPNTLLGGAGPDTITGGGGPDYLRGGPGNDSMTGGPGFNDMNGNQGADTLHGGAGDNWVVGGQGDDLLFGGGGVNLILGNLGADTLHAGAGNDVLRGGQGDDVLFGGPGADFISGDLGQNTETGGAGADTFHSFAAVTLDLVTNFSEAKGDRVMLDPGTGFTVSQVGADTVIDMTGGGRVILQGVAMASLQPGWIFEG